MHLEEQQKEGMKAKAIIFKHTHTHKDVHIFLKPALVIQIDSPFNMK